MPCYEPDHGPSTDAIYYKEKLDLVTRLLCEVTGIVKKYGSVWHELTTTVDGLTKWKRQHDADDAARKRKEDEILQRRALRERALKKLTSAERKELGV